MPTGYADGAKVYREAYCRGLTPDPELWVDEWADEYMRIPRDTGAAEPGKYRTARTPYAREPMRCLSPAHPCKRVVTKVASQLMKTQIALNWIGALIHMAPSNILTLLPSLALAKRVSSRIGKTIDATPELKARVAANRSRDARNTMDTKEFEGGTLYATTAGSAANLSELSARYAVWVVEWTQIIYLGEEEWPWPNQPPGSIVWGFVPDTGSGKEGSYLPPEAMEWGGRYHRRLQARLGTTQHRGERGVGHRPANDGAPRGDGHPHGHGLGEGRSADVARQIQCGGGEDRARARRHALPRAG